MHYKIRLLPLFLMWINTSVVTFLRFHVLYHELIHQASSVVFSSVDSVEDH